MRTILTAAALLAVAAPAWAQAKPQDPRKSEVVAKLNSLRVSLDFKDAPIEDAVNVLRDMTGINFHLDPELHTKLAPEQLKVTFKVNDLLLKSALKLMLSSRDMGAVYRDGVIVLQHKDKTTAAVTLEIYDVRDLLFKLQDFPGPRVELVSPSAGGGTALGISTFTLEEPKSAITDELILDIVKSNTGDKTWDEAAGANASLANGLLVVTQSRRVHEEVRRLLNLLRQFK